MPRFRLLAGSYVHKGPDGKDQVYKPGATVESDQDLAKRFGRAKFEPIALTEDELRTLAQARQEAAPAPSSLPPVHDDDGLERLTYQELQSLAASEEIDASGVRSKKDLIELIRATRAAD